MTRRRPASSGGELQLPFAVGRRVIGRHERAASKAITAARASGAIGPVDLAAVTLLRGLARALDGAELEGSAWAVAAVARELRETLTTMRLTPASRTNDGGDPFAEWLATISEAGQPDRKSTRL